MEIRKKRKNDHLKYARIQRFERKNGFEHYHLLNDSVPELNYDSICTSCKFLNKEINYPFMINAITGGTKRGRNINKALAEAAAEFHIPMAIGSQKVALKDIKAMESFSIVRKVNKDGIIIGNLSADASVHEVKEAIEMIGADAMQLHFNVPQEICMKEGERCFEGILNNIAEIREAVKIPIIAKETGFGVSPRCLEKFIRAGIEYVDISGYGGTNFVKIENKRAKKANRYSFLESWGIPTAVSLTECRKINKEIHIICSGGIQDGYDIIKSIRLGADLVGISGAFIQNAGWNLKKSFTKYIQLLSEQMTILMLLTGARTVDDIKQIPLYSDTSVWRLYGQGDRSNLDA